MEAKHLLTFTPSICQPTKDKKTGQETPAAYRGTVSLRVPNYDERQDLYEGYGLTDDEASEAAEAAAAGEDFEEALESRVSKSERTRRTKQLMRHAARLAPKFVVAIEIERLEDGFKFASFEDLDLDTDGNSVITEIATKLVGKFSVGKGFTAA